MANIGAVRHLLADDVLHQLTELFVRRGAPEHIRSDNGPEFTSEVARHWLACVGVQTLYIEPGSPWENDYIENFNGKLRDELLNGKLFYTLERGAKYGSGTQNQFFLDLAFRLPENSSFHALLILGIKRVLDLRHDPLFMAHF